MNSLSAGGTDVGDALGTPYGVRRSRIGKGRCWPTGRSITVCRCAPVAHRDHDFFEREDRAARLLRADAEYRRSDEGDAHAESESKPWSDARHSGSSRIGGVHC